MHKKLGPLELWQWAAIGVATGIIYYIYKVRQANNANATTAQTNTTPVDQQIRPYNTGLYAPTDPLTQGTYGGMTQQEMRQLIHMLGKLENPHQHRTPSRQRHDEQVIARQRREIEALKDRRHDHAHHRHHRHR